MHLPFFEEIPGKMLLQASSCYSSDNSFVQVNKNPVTGNQLQSWILQLKAKCQLPDGER